MEANTIHEKIAIGLSVLVSLVFILMTTFHSVNFPAAADDFILFVQQLHDKLLMTSTVNDVVSYFFAPAFGIHTKLSARVLGLLSYGIFGVINFKFLIITGNLCYLFMVHKISGVAVKIHKEVYLRPIILSLLLIPLALNFRPVFITGFPFHILFAFLCFFFLTKKKIGFSFLFFLLTAFNAGSGLFVGFISFAALIIYSFRDKKYIPYVLMYLIGASALLIFLLSYKTSATTSGFNLSFEAIVSYIVYVLVFIQKSVTPYFISYKNLPIIYIIIGLVVCAIFIYMLVRRFQETTDSPFFYLCVYLFMTGLLAAVIRSGGTDFLPNVASRYEHYSVVFVASFVGLVYDLLSSPKVKTGIGIFFLLLFFIRLYTNTSSHKIGYQYNTFVTPNGQKVRNLVSDEKYRYLHDFKYENIAQNSSFEEVSEKRKRTSKSGVRLLKYRDEKRVGVVSFMFKNKNEYKNVRVVLQQGKKRYSLVAYYARNKYYCVIAKNKDLPKGKYLLKIWYEDEQGKYEQKLKTDKKIEFY